jgi:hypothetical protein
LGDELEFWPEKTGGKDPVRFVKIAALHSELVAVSSSGHLYQWRWCDMTPFRGDNPSGELIDFVKVRLSLMAYRLYQEIILELRALD